MAFKDTILTFEDNRIISDDNHHNMEVMMSWEAPIMEKSAEYICESKGDILEIGFGMGICSDYIQAQGVNSHTIVEIHPQILEKLYIWAEDKDNVIIVEGDWSSVELGTYDGIFLDTFGDENLSKFKEFISSQARDGARITYWNNYETEDNMHSFDSISFEPLNISPIDNLYTDIENTYYIQKVVI